MQTTFQVVTFRYKM